MSEYVAFRPLAVGRLRDLVDLGKPRLSLLVIFTTAVGYWLAPASSLDLRALVFLLATSCLVAAANTLNCWIERELDARMLRTRNRPLPAGRLVPRTAMISGLLLGSLSLITLLLITNPRTTLLGACALLSYVLIYTPLKRVTPWSLWVGALPGALPPLMGWTAATNTIALPGLFVFGILFFWQLPHFVAISLYLEEDFRRGGFQVLSVARGDAVARLHLGIYAVILVVFSLLGRPLGVAGSVYTAVAAISGLVFLAVALPGVWRGSGDAWARRVFGVTLLHLPVLITTLVLDAL